MGSTITDAYYTKLLNCVRKEATKNIQKSRMKKYSSIKTIARISLQIASSIQFHLFFRFPFKLFLPILASRKSDSVEYVENSDGMNMLSRVSMHNL
jgi:hypothetical protein